MISTSATLSWLPAFVFELINYITTTTGNTSAFNGPVNVASYSNTVGPTYDNDHGSHSFTDKKSRTLTGLSRTPMSSGKSGPALAGTENRLVV